MRQHLKYNIKILFIIYTWILFLFITPLFANSHYPQEFLKSIRGTKDEGTQIYKHFCANCHDIAPKISLGAPRIGVEGDWGSRLKQGSVMLFKHTDEGFNTMPPRGGCFECTDEQLILALAEMVPNRNKKTLLNKLHAHIKSTK